MIVCQACPAQATCQWRCTGCCLPGVEHYVCDEHRTAWIDHRAGTGHCLFCEGDC